MNKVLILVFMFHLVVISGCMPSMKMIPKPSTGYEAIKFNQTYECVDHSINTYRFLANTILVNDRNREDNGQKVYCGPVSISSQMFESCIGIENLTTIIIGSGASFKEVRREVPQGTISFIQVE